MTDKESGIFIYIIESPNENDFYNNKSEGSLLQQLINLHGFPCFTKTVISKAKFEESLKSGLRDAMAIFPNLLPLIHISAHGYEDGICLSNREIITWNDLRSLFLPINIQLKNCLIVCMSSCKGFSACKMVMTPHDDPYPFFYLVGNVGEPTWSETAVAFATLYHWILNKPTRKIPEAVKAMNIASGNYDFWVTEAKPIKIIYNSYWKKTSGTITMQEFLTRKLPSDISMQIRRRLNIEKEEIPG